MSIPPGFRALPLPLIQLSLAAVLKCGQSFRWSSYPLLALTPSEPSHEYRLCLRDRVVCLRQSPDTLFYRSVFAGPPPHPPDDVCEAETLTWLKDYFQLDVDLVKLYDEWSERDPVFRSFRTRFEGIRMLRQDPWENLISFICSSNNNISRITKMVKSLCKQYSPPLLSLPPPTPTPGCPPTPPLDPAEPAELEPEEFHPFPPPSSLARSDVSATLRSLGFGYRADFIQKTAQMLIDEHGAEQSSSNQEAPELWLRTLRDMPTAEARLELLKFMGVGRKVADCVMLMSLDKKEVIPIDTHVHQIAIKHYGMRGTSGAKQAMNPKLYDEINAKLGKVWGDYAGWAHSVLFTADLKSFASYGLPTPSPTPAKRSSPLAVDEDDTLPPPLPLPTTIRKSRKRKQVTETVAVTSAAISDTDSSMVAQDAGSLAERVKRRRR
ncbi:DNA glycosylase [Dentipellis sp. KUC8613]|nr:DNA glycosylase [Dentipellis sp. KUC8613]